MKELNIAATVDVKKVAQMALQAEDSRTIRSLSKAVALRSYPNLFE